MCNKRDNIAGPIDKNFIVQKLLNCKPVSNHFLTVRAEEKPAEDPQGDTEKPKDNPSEPPAFNFETLISKARKEEKEKQYAKIKKLESQLETLTNQHNTDILKIGELEEKLTKAEELSNSKNDSEVVTTLKESIKVLEEEKTALETKIKNFKEVNVEELETTLRSEIGAEYEVKAYRLEQLTALTGTEEEILVPEIVMGVTKEEIDESLKVAKERSKSIREKIGAKKPAKGNVTNPSAKFDETEISLDYLASLNPRSKEYAEVREQLGLNRR